MNNLWFSAPIGSFFFLSRRVGERDTPIPTPHIIGSANSAATLMILQTIKECWEHEHLARSHRGSQKSSDLSNVFCNYRQACRLCVYLTSGIDFDVGLRCTFLEEGDTFFASREFKRLRRQNRAVTHFHNMTEQRRLRPCVWIIQTTKVSSCNVLGGSDCDISSKQNYSEGLFIAAKIVISENVTSSVSSCFDTKPDSLW